MDLVNRIKEIYQSVDRYEEALTSQISQSSAVDNEVFRARFQAGLGDENV